MASYFGFRFVVAPNQCRDFCCVCTPECNCEAMTDAEYPIICPTIDTFYQVRQYWLNAGMQNQVLPLRQLSQRLVQEYVNKYVIQNYTFRTYDHIGLDYMTITEHAVWHYKQYMEVTSMLSLPQDLSREVVPFMFRWRDHFPEF